MTHRDLFTGRRTAARAWRRGAVVLAALLPLGACDLDVADPQIVREEQLEGEAALPTLRAGAISDFGYAYAGDAGTATEGIILVGGLRSDEWLNRDTFGTRQEIDRGNIQVDNASNQDAFRALQRARVSAERAAERFAEAAPDSPGHAEMLSLAGYAYVLLAENYCSGIPFSTLLPSGQFEFGEPLTTEQVYQRAIERFDAAIAVAQAAEDDNQLHLARVGKGRALLNLGRFADAAAAVRDVPTAFEYLVEFSTNTDAQNNAVYYFNNIARRWGVANLEGGAGMPYVTANDPRVPTSLSTRNGLDNVGLVRNQLKYPDRAAPIPLATGVEARLIEAEAALNGVSVGRTALAILNDLRGDVGLAALGSASVDALFRERAFWLFSTAHRLGDMRRLLEAPYNRDFEDVYPTGEYFKAGGLYGTDADLPIPVDEQNNPNFATCLDRSN